MDALYLREGSCECYRKIRFCSAAWVARLTLNLGQELEHGGGDFVGVSLQGEVAGVEELDCGVGHVSAIGFGARRNEKHIVLSPYGEEGRLVLAEVGLKFRVKFHIRRVVEIQIELNIFYAGALEQSLIEVVSFGRDGFRIGDAFGVLPARAAESEDFAAEQFAVTRRRILPAAAGW